MFVTGNSWWKERAKHGRDALFTDPKKLLEAAIEYFEKTEARKWFKKDWVGKDADEVYRESSPPFTITGLCVYLGVAENWWRSFKATETYKNSKSDDVDNPDFATVVTHIEQIIYMQKFEGAAVGAFNASVICRDLGLRDGLNVATPPGESIEVTMKISDTPIKPSE